MRFRLAFPFVFGVLIGACAPEPEQAAEEMAEATTLEYADASAAIAVLANRYEEAYNLGQASMVADLHTDDAVMLSANSSVQMGREAISASLEQFMTAFSPTITISPSEQLTMGDWVLDRGSYTLALSLEGGDAANLTGNYMSLSRQTDDGLKLYRLAVNGDAPPPIPMPGPEAMAAEPMTGGPMADLIASYAEHYNLGHASMVADLWADDAVAMFAEQPMASGRAAIEASIAAAVADGSPQLTIMDSETKLLGDGWAVDRGSYTAERTVDGQTVTRSGTYMIVCRQSDDGAWKIQWGLSNAAPMGTM